MEKSYIGCYWGDRQESSSTSATALATVLTGLARFDPVFLSWFETGTSASPDQPVSADPAALTSLLEAGVNRADFGNEALTRLGYSFDLWNGAPGDQASSLGGTVGVHAGKPDIVNNVVLNLPTAYTPNTAALDLLIDAWDPDWATWTTRALRRAQGRDFREVVGWSTYLRCSTPTKAPDGVRTRRVGNGIVVSFEKNGADVADDDVLAVRDWLGTSNVLTPAHSHRRA